MLKIGNFTEPIIGYKGGIISEKGDAGEDIPVTLASLFLAALNTQVEGDGSLDASLKRFQLSTRIAAAADEIELTVEDAVVIKQRVGALFSPLLYGRTCEAIDGNVSDEKTPQDDEKPD